MAIMPGELYSALRRAGVPDDQAQKAAEEVLAFDRRLARIETLVAVNTAVPGVLAPVIVGIFWLVWEIGRSVDALRAGVGG